MEKVMTLKIEGDFYNTEIEIDNSSSFKDFRVDYSRNDEKKNTRSLFIQNNKAENKIEINGVTFSGVSLTLLKEFINQ